MASSLTAPAGPRPLPSDERLAQGVQAGSSDDLAVLVTRHHGPLLGFLYRLTGGDRLLAEDLAQEVFLRVLRGIGRYRPERPFKPWLYAVAVNAARDHYKRAETRRTEALPPDFDAPGEPSPLHALTAAETWAQVAAAVQALPAPQREVLLLRYTEDLSLAEIAAVLAIPVGTVKSRLSVALGRLRARLAAEEG
ncbi:MAG: sigma-70 family RNA polymerase sigma factor [Anaerolineales bacterium]|nr:sigma-70 family RNA polymerase sigma factor [Anaerolineales bacterium]